MKKKITYFLKNYVASLFTYFEKIFAISKFLLLSVYFKVLRPLYFICLKYYYFLKIFNVCPIMKVNCRDLYYFILNVKCTQLQYCSKIFILQFFKQIKLCLCFLFKKNFYLQKCLCHVYVYAMAVTCTEHLMCSHIC